MILVDTSIWVEHLRRGCKELMAALNTQQVLIHPFVIGELACGHLRQRGKILDLLQALPPAVQASNSEVMEAIDRHQIMGRGIGFIDAHIIISAQLSQASLWTQDRRLASLVEELGLGT